MSTKSVQTLIQEASQFPMEKKAVAVRMTLHLLARVDTVTKRLGKSRNDVLIATIEDGIEIFEKILK